ncbi:hypothetical protein AHAS_Ahas19G0165800 [Arachis hypogaea]
MAKTTVFKVVNMSTKLCRFTVPSPPSTSLSHRSSLISHASLTRTQVFSLYQHQSPLTVSNKLVVGLLQSSISRAFPALVVTGNRSSNSRNWMSSPLRVLLTPRSQSGTVVVPVDAGDKSSRSPTSSSPSVTPPLPSHNLVKMSYEAISYFYLFLFMGIRKKTSLGAMDVDSDPLNSQDNVEDCMMTGVEENVNCTCDCDGSSSKCVRFGVCKGDTARGQDGTQHRRRFFRNKKGKRAKKYISNSNRKRKHKVLTCTGCEDMLAVYFDSKTAAWKVKKLVEKHNHDLVPQCLVHLIPNHRGMTEAQKAQANTMHDNGLQPLK